jgi:hypothetical protein
MYNLLALCAVNAPGIAVRKPHYLLAQCCECDRLKCRAVSDSSRLAQVPQGSRGQWHSAIRPKRCAISRSAAATLGAQWCPLGRS